MSRPEGEGEAGADEPPLAHAPVGHGVRPVLLVRWHQLITKNEANLTIMLFTKYLSLAGGEEAGEEQFTSRVSPTLDNILLVVYKLRYRHKTK